MQIKIKAPFPLEIEEIIDIDVDIKTINEIKDINFKPLNEKIYLYFMLYGGVEIELLKTE